MHTKKPNPNKQDLSGRDRVVRNVIFSWGGYLLVFIGGFVMPRLIDESLGQERLGIWDLAWGLVNYLNLTMLGIGSSVNRFVARYRSQGDEDALSKTIASVFYIQILIAVIVLILTYVVVNNLSFIFGSKIASLLNETEWVISLLGITLAFRTALDSSRGIVTGYHRWDLFVIHNTIFYLLQISLMILALYFGTGLIGLSVAYLTSAVIQEFSRMVLAFKLCSSATLRLSAASFNESRELFRYGIKTIVNGLPTIIIVQSTKLLLAMNLGPSVLAVFVRPLAICLAARTFIDRYANLLTPTASAIHASEGNESTIELFIKSVRSTAYMTFPPLTYLLIYGDSVIYHWMGAEYVNRLLFMILVAGYILPISQRPVMKILAGMNMHGKIGVRVLIATLAIYSISSFGVYQYGWSLESAALSFSISIALGNGVLAPYMACRKINISYLDYVKEVFLFPLLISFVFALILLAARGLVNPISVPGLIFSFIVGFVYVTPVYWFFILPDSLKIKITSMFKLGTQK